MALSSPDPSATALGVRRYPLSARWLRWAARFVDWVLGIVAILVPAFLFGMARPWLSDMARPWLSQQAGGRMGWPEWFMVMNVIDVLVVFSGFLLLTAYQQYLTVVRGATIGKKLMGLRVVRRDGIAIRWFPTVLVRDLIPLIAFIVPGAKVLLVIDASTIFAERRACIHDMMAGTLVLDVGHEPENWTPEAIAATRWNERFDG